MKIYTEIKEQIDFLKRPDSTWVQEYPEKPLLACAVVRRPSMLPGDMWQTTEALSDEAKGFLDTTLFADKWHRADDGMVECRIKGCKYSTLVPAGDRHYIPSDQSYTEHYNDFHAKDEQEIVTLLKKAYYKAKKDNI